MEKILVAVDGSENGRKALKKAKEIGRAMNSEITILHVVNDQRNNPYIVETEYRNQIMKAYAEQGEKILKSELEMFEDYKGKVTTLLKFGESAKEIINTAEEGKYDLVVMGSRGLSTLSRMMLGSISSKVVHNIRVSVLIVR